MQKLIINSLTFAVDQDGGDNNVVMFSKELLTGLIDPGAVLPITFSLNLTLSEGLAARAMNGEDIFSQGVQIKYAIDNNDILGFADINLNGLFDSGDRKVFTIIDNGDSFYFELLDQIDHYNDTDESVLSLDVSALFNAQDGDGGDIAIPANTLNIEIYTEIKGQA